MRKTIHLIAVISLLVTFGVAGGSIGIIDTAEAGSSGSHSRHSLAGRTFLVNVKNLDDGTSNLNCYTFEEDGTWIDPRFLGPTIEELLFPGDWIQHTGGFITRYTAFAKSPAIPAIELPPLRLIQNEISCRRATRWIGMSATPKWSHPQNPRRLPELIIDRSDSGFG